MPGPIPSAEGFVAASHAPPRTAASTMPGPVPVLGAALPVLGPRAEPAGAALGRPRRRLALGLGLAAALLSAAAIIVAVAPSSTQPSGQPPVLADRSVQPDSTTPSLVPTPRAQPEAADPEAEHEPSGAASAAEGTDEVVAVATPPDEVEPSVDPPRTRARRSRRRARKASPEANAPEDEATPTPVASSAKPSPPSATELLRKAEAALARGDADDAYRLAARSRRTRASHDASAVMARAACRMGDTDKAKQALRALPLLQRAGVRRDCRQSGSRIGL